MKLKALFLLPLAFIAGCGLLFDDPYVNVTNTQRAIRSDARPCA